MAQFYPGQLLQRGDLSLYLVDSNGDPINAYEITYDLYYVDPVGPPPGLEVLIPPSPRTPVNPIMGEYYASLMVPPSATNGTYRIRWTFKETAGGPDITVVQDFEVTSKEIIADPFTEIEKGCIRTLRILLRDNFPDRNYHFRPPEHEGVIQNYNRVFGYVWEDYELLEYLKWGLAWWNMFPPATYICTLEELLATYPNWKIAVLWGAMALAANALAFNWIQEEFDYSIGGISLSIDRSSKYESMKSNAEGQFEKATEAKSRTVKVIRGLKQPRYGIGIRSAFGPAVGRGVLSPRNFL
jgi:hypothetical protein